MAVPSSWTEPEFPACAGMIRTLAVTPSSVTGVPRMRGDDPFRAVRLTSLYESSPHARG